MKKLLLFVFISLSSLFSFSQTIEIDKVNEKGDRYISGSLEPIRSLMDKYYFFVSLDAFQAKGDDEVTYSIVLRTNANSPISVPKGGRLLIKLEDDSVIELRTLIEYSDKIGEVVTGAIVHTNYSVSPSFVVTPKQINKISEGVKKIRLETSLDPIDKVFKKDKMGRIIKEEYALIQEALQKDKSFSDGF